MIIDVAGSPTYLYSGGRAIDPDQPSVMFVHGAGLDHTVWTLPSRYFVRKGYNVMGVDLPGHGQSQGALRASIEDMADWLVEVLDALDVTQTALVGHSMGSLVALEASARHVPRVRSLALLGSGVPMPVAGPLQQAADANEQAAVDMLTLWGYSKAAQIGGNDTPGMWMVGSTSRLFERAANGVIANDLAACNAYQHGLDSAAAVQCPALLILGSHDIMTPPLRGNEVAQAIPDSRTVILKGSGHTMMSEQPDAVLDALITIV